MEKDLFTNLPSEIKFEILSRLPIGSVFKCKLVNRSWRSMIESPDFAKSYKSAPCLAVSKNIEPTQPHEYWCKVYEVEDGDATSKGSCKKPFDLSFPHRLPVYASVNGLLCLTLTNLYESHDMYICNPVTREYITITSPEYDDDLDSKNSYGFGVSRKSRQFKVVRIFDKLVTKGADDSVAGCQVYTLGIGSWRSVAPNNSSLVYHYYSLRNTNSIVGKLLNGNLHWLAYDMKKAGMWISCFDLETELFTTLRTPCAHGRCSLLAWRDCLGISDYSYEGHETVIWLMKDYGDEKSWTKQYVIPDYYCVIEVLNDGYILLEDVYKRTMLCYSNKTKAMKETNLIQEYKGRLPLLVSYTPTFLPLTTISSTKNIKSF